MKNEAYRAKNWLNRNYQLSRQLEADQRMLEIMRNRLQSGVARYDSDGSESHDPDRAKARHDDALLEYSLQMEKVEKEARRLTEEDLKTRKAIGELSDPTHRAVAIDRYINRLKWDKVAALEHRSVAQVFRDHKDMLEKMAEVLRSGKYD